MKVTGLIMGPLFVVGGVYFILLWASGEGDGSRQSALAAVGILFGAYFILSVLRYRFLIATTFIEKRDIKTTRIRFTDVKCLRLFEDQVQVEGSDAIIRLPRDLAGRDKALDVLIPFLKRYHHISITGDDTLLQKYKLGAFR